MEKLKPSKKQLDFLEWELGGFFHFGIRTFYEGHKDWDGLPMPLSGFNPTRLDCENWIVNFKAAGAKYAILVCKHHDGFANWPSKFSEYHVGITPWKDGKGDVVQEFVDACRKHDIKVGLYYSPAEMGVTKRTKEEHDEYFINQISELLTDYGKIDYLWFDGCGSENHEYDKERIVKTIRGLQPDILIFHMWDQNTRWCGNETGIGGVRNVNQVSALDFSALTGEDKDMLSEPRFLPTECNLMMRDRNWFYSEYDVNTVKSLKELMGIYYYSVGSGGTMLINIGPDRRGLLPDIDAERLLEFGSEIKRRFGSPIPSVMEQTNDGVTIRFEKEQFVNHVVLTEDLTEGDGVEAFDILAKGGLLYRPVCIYTGAAIGSKRIVTFPYIRAHEIIVKITKANGSYALGKPEAFLVE